MYVSTPSGLHSDYSIKTIKLKKQEFFALAFFFQNHKVFCRNFRADIVISKRRFFEKIKNNFAKMTLSKQSWLNSAAEGKSSVAESTLKLHLLLGGENGKIA